VPGSGADRRAKNPIENGHVRVSPSPMHMLGMARARRQGPQTQALQDRAHATLIHQRDPEFALDSGGPVLAAPAHHPVGLRVRTVLDPRDRLLGLLRGQARLPAWAPRLDSASGRRRCSGAPSRAGSGDPCRRRASRPSGTRPPASARSPATAAPPWRPPRAPPACATPQHRSPHARSVRPASSFPSINIERAIESYCTRYGNSRPNRSRVDVTCRWY
jgi:hypothetical protein